MSKYEPILYYKKEDKLLKVSKEIVLDELYFQKAIMPTEDIIKNQKSKIKDKYILDFFEDILKGIKVNKIIISKIEEKIPLYDVYTENIYLVSKENVYERVIHTEYRFPDPHLLVELINKKKKLSNQIPNKIQKEEVQHIFNEKDYKKYNKFKKNILLTRSLTKLKLMINFMKNFNLKVLYNTYIKVFYLYSNQVGKNITTCKKPSFLAHFYHIQPYYTRSELINLALNLNLIKPNDTYYDINKIEKLCQLITYNDINADILYKHQKYIADENKIGLIQYYSLQGSGFINAYLRNQTQYRYENIYLEKIIEPMWKLINNAPGFDKEYIVYRFMRTDAHLADLQIGEMYIEPGFMSTTRDPFYRSDLYKFGFILLKIRVPAKEKGVGLCIETYSHFPTEEEILFAPLSVFKLDKKDNQITYYHTDSNFASEIKTRYEFTYIGHKAINFKHLERDELIENKVIDFLKISKMQSDSLDEKIKYFIKNYSNTMYQFLVKINDNLLLPIMIESFDGTGAYRKFYALEVENGYSLYCMHDNYMLFLIELGIKNDQTEMAVNYYVKYNMINRQHVMADDDFLYLLSSIAYYFGVINVTIYADYLSCDASEKRIIDQDKYEKKQRSYVSTHKDVYKQLGGSGSNAIKQYGGSYCIDFYNYLKHGVRKFDRLNLTHLEFIAGYSYEQLDRLKSTDPFKILKKDDPDEIYQIFDKTYKEFVTPDKNNLGDFYVWLSEKQCMLIDIFVLKLERLYIVDNPFVQDYYLLEPMTYLYNKKLISALPYRLLSKNITKEIKRELTLNTPLLGISKSRT